MNTDEICIRLAGFADAGQLFDVHKNSVETFCVGHYSDDQIRAWFEDRPPDLYLNAIRSNRIWVAKNNESVLGFLEIRPGEIEKLFVRGNAAGHGIGSRLFKLGLKKVRETHDGVITVLALRNSQTFYEKFGFVKVGESHLVRGKSRVRIRVVRMELH